MQAVQPTDFCGICMDETNRDFLYKTCCSLLICRKCYNQLEVESFPSHSSCPGCRQNFNKVGYSVDVVNNAVVPRAYCGLSMPNIKSLKEHDAHVLSCVDCLKKVIKGNSWFEKQLNEKFTGMKRKLQTMEDEVYVRNQRIRELTTHNAFLVREVAKKTAMLNTLTSLSVTSSDDDDELPEDVPLPEAPPQPQEAPVTPLRSSAAINAPPALPRRVRTRNRLSRSDYNSTVRIFQFADAVTPNITLEPTTANTNE